MGRLTPRTVVLALLMAVPAAAPLPSGAHLPTTAGFEEPGEGRDEAVSDTRQPTVVAAFARESYRPGQPARLVNPAQELAAAGSRPTGRRPSRHGTSRSLLRFRTS